MRCCFKRIVRGIASEDQAGRINPNPRLSPYPHSADVLRSPRSDSSTLRDGAAWARSTAAAISKAREAVVVGVAREANLPAAAPNDLERTSKALEQAATLTEAAADDLHRAADAYEAGR